MDDLKKPEVFAAYYEKVYRELYYFALHTLKNPQDAEDAVSETVTDAFAAVEKLRDNEKFRAWIFQILSNKCRRKLKEYTKRKNKNNRKTRKNLKKTLAFRRRMPYNKNVRVQVSIGELWPCAGSGRRLPAAIRVISAGPTP